MEIRQAGIADLPAIEQLIQRAYAPYIAEIGVRPGPLEDDYVERVRRGHASVAVEGGAVVGLLILIPQADHALVENVAVDPDRQSEGIGRALLAFAEQAARTAGTPVLRLYTHARMSRNRALYRRLGYEQVERRDEQGFDRVFFVKRLSA